MVDCVVRSWPIQIHNAGADKEDLFAAAAAAHMRFVEDMAARSETRGSQLKLAGCYGCCGCCCCCR